MKIKFLFAWYDFWVGFYWDKKNRSLYILPIPMFGFVIQFGCKPQFSDELIDSFYND
jgi:hypothetical protein